jgi:uncharacterized membrane protein YdjX (TVP38/TMEM64 family)
MASHLASRILSTSTQKARRIISGRRGQQEDGRGRDHDLRDYYNARAHTNSMMETELMKSSAATSPRRPNDSRTLINFDDEQQQNESSGIGSSDAETAGPASAGASAGLVHYYVCMPSGGLEAVTEEQAGARAALRHSPSPSDSDHFRGEGDGDDGRSRASSSHGGATGVSLGGDRPMIAELLHFARHRNWKKKVLTLFIVVTSLLVFYDLLFLGHIRTWIASALDWMTLNPFGAVFSFIVFFVVATLLFVPPAILMFGAGYAFSNVSESFWFGFFASSVVSFVGCVLGAIAAFLRSRYMMRDLIELFSKRYPIVNALDRAMERKGFRVMLLLRLWYVWASSARNMCLDCCSLLHPFLPLHSSSFQPHHSFQWIESHWRGDERVSGELHKGSRGHHPYDPPVVLFRGVSGPCNACPGRGGRARVHVCYHPV